MCNVSLQVCSLVFLVVAYTNRMTAMHFAELFVIVHCLIMEFDFFFSKI